MQKAHLAEIDPAAPVTEQATHWWVVLNSGEATPGDHRAFGEWVARSPERIEAFLQVARLTRALRSSSLRWPGTPVEELIREARAAAAEPVRLPSRERDGGGSRELRSGAPGSEREIGPLLRPRCAVATVVLTVVAGGFFHTTR